MIAPPLPGAVIGESSMRRPAWTPGHPVRLADGASWWLPRVESALSLFEPETSTSVARTFHLANEVAGAELDLDRYATAIKAYHDQLARVAVLMLRSNYDLPEPTWRRLLAFEDLSGMLRLALAVSEAIINSVPAWMPLLLTSRLDQAEQLPPDRTRPSIRPESSGGRDPDPPSHPGGRRSAELPQAAR